MTEFSKTWNWIDGEWHEGNHPIMGARTHAAWLGSSVFDGARAFEGVMPDLDLHCARINRSALSLGLAATMEAGEIEALCHEGLKRFDDNAELYIRPIYWAEHGGPTTVMPDPSSTRFCLTMFEAAVPPPTNGFNVCVSRQRRPTQECAPVDAKAGCLYPNNGRALQQAMAAGFTNAVLLDFLGNVAELATANIFLVKDGVVLTPSANGTFLAGITRSRVMKLLGEAGFEVRDQVLSVQDFLDADEIFSTGNYNKVMSIIGFEDRKFQPGPVAAKARKLYWEWAHG